MCCVLCLIAVSSVHSRPSPLSIDTIILLLLARKARQTGLSQEAEYRAAIVSSLADKFRNKLNCYNHLMAKGKINLYYKPWTTSHYKGFQYSNTNICCFNHYYWSFFENYFNFLERSKIDFWAFLTLHSEVVVRQDAGIA